MKKVLLILLTIAVAAMTLALSVLSVNPEELSEYGQVTVAPHYLATAPVQDGEISDGEYGDAIHTLIYDPEDKSQYWNGLGESDAFKRADVMPEEAILYMGYDAQYLYVAAVVKDENHYSPGEGLEVWDGDYFEMDLGFRFDGTVDGMLDRSRIAFGVSGSGNPFGYAAAPVPNYAKFKVNHELSGYSVIRDDDESTTVYEAALSWKDLTGKDEAPEKGFFMYQFGVANSEYADLAVSNGTKAYLGCWRYAARIPAGVAANDAKIALHIFTIDKSVLPVEPETSTEETTTQPETSTEETTTEPVSTTEAVTTAPETEGTTTDTTKDTTPTEESDPAIGIIIAVATVLAVAIIVVAVVVIVKGKKK